jgi:N-acetylglucosaminyl-diphospho-decaprenol L-rhamnosyltransferase
MTAPPAYAAVVVLHRSHDELAALLDSLDRVAAPAPRLVVVDTGPDDGGAGLAARRGAHVILRRDNPGFGAASNAGLEHVTEDVTVLLNPDVEVLDGSLARLAELARAHPRALHAPRLLNLDGSVQRSAHPLPGTVGALLPALVHPPKLPRALRERVEPFRAQTPRTVGWAIAACLAAATTTLRDLGPFDPAVHLFAEDMELCLRARAAGMPTVLHPELALRHHGGHSLLRDGERFEAMARRRREAIAATLGRPAQAADDAAQALTFATRIAARAALRRPHERETAQLKALHIAVKHRDPSQGPGRGEQL